MKKCVLSYSMTGNNDALAKRLSQRIGAEHIIVSESKRSMSKITLDIMFGRIPKTSPDASLLDGYDEIIVVGPVWMEKTASPLRPYLQHIKKRNLPYKFITISGGALNKNPGLKKDVTKYGGENLSLFKDMYIADLLDKDDVTRKDTGSYKLSQNDLDILEKAAMQVL